MRSYIFSVILALICQTYSSEKYHIKPPLPHKELYSTEEIKNYNSGKLLLKQYDSIRAILKFTDTLYDSCLDRSCYIQKKEFNLFLNRYSFDSITNKDSIRTNILFDLLAQKYLRIISSDINVAARNEKNICTPDSTHFFSYKILALSSTDSQHLVKTLNSNINKPNLFLNPVEIIFNDLPDKYSDVADLFFYLKNQYLDFKIKKSILDSLEEKTWSPVMRSDFGYYSIYIKRKNILYPEYNELKRIIISSYSDFLQNHIPKDSVFIFNNLDTLFIKLWTIPAVFSDSGKMIALDTNKIESIKIPDCYLPANIRYFIRHEYYKKGIVFFDNFRSNYGLWSLKVEEIKIKHEKKTNPGYKNYIVARNAHMFFNMLNSKQIESVNKEKENIYLNNLRKKYRLKNNPNNDTLTALYQATSEANLQIRRETFHWIKNNIIFLNDIFFEKYLPTKITQYQN